MLFVRFLKNRYNTLSQMKKDVIILKLGGSIITDKTKPYTPNIPVIQQLAKEIKRAGVPVIIIHGQGSFAHTSAKKYGGKKGYVSLLGAATVFKDAMSINSIIMEELLKAKLPAVSFRPNSLFLAQNGKLKKSNLDPILTALSQGFIPVLYGDVIMDLTWKTTIFSGETATRYLLNFLESKKIKISMVIQVGITNGVYDLSGQIIRQITDKNYSEIKKDIFKSNSTDVTGGMQHKVEEAMEISKKGVKTYIINGTVKNELMNILKNKPSSLMTKISNL